MKNVPKILREKQGFAWAFAIWVVISIILGCAYGKIRNSPVESGRIYAFIEENYENFHATYSGERDKPGAIRFDPKDDEVILTGNGWHPIESKRELHDLLDNMSEVYRRYRGIIGALGPQLYLILDKNNRTIGYLFSPIDGAVVRTDGTNYSIDPVTELDAREQAYPKTSPRRKRQKAPK